MPTDSLDDRVVVITGGAGGAGERVSLRWLKAGASVLVVSYGEESLKALRAAWQSSGSPDPKRLVTLSADVSTEAGAQQMVAQARAAFGRDPDTLIHMVGGFAMGAVDAPDAPATWERMMKMNVVSNLHCYRAVLPGMRARGGGWIVGIGSRAAIQPAAQISAYAASKAALVALTKSLSAEVRSHNIHVNLILASTIDTPANRRAMGDKNADKWVRPDDIADATMFLCSPRAGAVHGATLEVYAQA
jgi:NAD(P)-dependent dehydrogenase (short-subunit alcohol dehydrogenase family)